MLNKRDQRFAPAKTEGTLEPYGNSILRDGLQQDSLLQDNLLEESSLGITPYGIKLL